MANIHTPERIEGESFEDYKIRRQVSKQEVKFQTHPLQILELKEDHKRYQWNKLLAEHQKKIMQYFR